MDKKLFITGGVFVISSLLSSAFAQHVGVPVQGVNVTGTSGSMSYTQNMDMTNSETFAKDFDQYSMRPILQNGRLYSYGTEYNVKGTRLLFDDWVKGIVVKNSGEEINSEKYSFNFDKVTNNLLVLVNKKEIIEVYKDSIQSFKFNSRGQVYSFEKVTPILRYRFVQVLVNDKNRYSLYKSIKTRFVAADFNTNGLTDSGNPYDEFVDANQYYIMYKDEVRPVELKFTSIKRALKENSSRVKDFYADHIMDEVDEYYLTSIIQYLNK